MYPEISLKEARSYFGRFRRSFQNPYALNYLAMMDYEEGNLKSAIKNAEKAIELKPDYPEPYVNLAAAYYQQGEEKKAIELLLTCMQKCPSIPANVHQSLLNIVSVEVFATIYPNGRAYMTSAPAITEKKLRSEIAKALKENPKNYLEFTETCLVYNNTIDAAAFLDELEPPAEVKNLHTYLRARLAYLGGDNETFDSLAQALLKTDWSDYSRLLEIGNICYETGDLHSAVEFYKAGLEHIYPPDIWYELKFNSNIGACYMSMEDFGKAEDYMLKALELYPDDVITLMNLGILYFELGDTERSREMFLEASKYPITPSQDAVINKYLNEKLKKE